MRVMRSLPAGPSVATNHTTILDCVDNKLSLYCFRLISCIIIVILLAILAYISININIDVSVLEKEVYPEQMYHYFIIIGFIYRPHVLILRTGRQVRASGT